MSRNTMVAFIKEYFAFVESKIRLGAKNNLLDENVLSESTFREIMNITFETDYKNANVIQSNYKGVDLVDHTNKKHCQVTSDKSKGKIDDTISRLPESLEGYHLYFLIFVIECKSIKGHDYDIDTTLFTPKEDIINLTDLLGYVMDLENEPLSQIYKICKSEMEELIIDVEMNESNLSKVISTIAKSELAYSKSSKKAFKYENKINHNKLVNLKRVIKDISVYTLVIDGIYDAYDKESSNISLSVLSLVSSYYDEGVKNFSLETPKVSDEFTKSDFIFEYVIDRCMEYIKNSNECNDIPYEEILLYVKIIVVNAFLRCDIFENPGGYRYDIISKC